METYGGTAFRIGYPVWASIGALGAGMRSLQSGVAPVRLHKSHFSSSLQRLSSSVATVLFHSSVINE